MSTLFVIFVHSLFVQEFGVVCIYILSRVCLQMGCVCYDKIYSCWWNGHVFLLLLMIHVHWNRE